MLKLPKKFLVPLFVYFLFGCFHLVLGLVNKNLFAFRDIVLCGYILFLPITFIIFSKKENLLSFLRVLILANIIGLLVGRLWMFNYGSSRAPIHFIHTLPTFNLGLYYGIAMSFLVAFFSLIKRKKYKFFVLILMAFNIYIVMFFKVRTIGVAGIALAIFFSLVLGRKFIKNILCYLALFLFVIIAIFYQSDCEILNKVPSTIGRAKGDMKTFVAEIIGFDRPVEEKTVSQEVPVDTSPKHYKIISSETAPEGFSEEISQKSSDSDREVPAYIPNKSYKIISSETAPEGFRICNLPSEKFGHRNNLFWRLDIWYQAIHFGLKSPLIGRGFGIYPRYVIWRFVKPTSGKIGVDSKIIPTHNHLVSIFYKMGFFGLGLFLFINGYTFLY